MDNSVVSSIFGYWFYNDNKYDEHRREHHKTSHYTSHQFLVAYRLSPFETLLQDLRPLINPQADDEMDESFVSAATLQKYRSILVGS